MLKTLCSVALSLALAFVLCLVLLSAGIIEVNREGLRDKIETVRDNVFLALGPDIEKSPENRTEESQSLRAPVQKQAPKPADDPIQSTKTAPAPDENRVHEQILEFLAERTGNMDPDVENRLSEFLIQDLGLAPADAAEFVRMCFWKGFVTLQKPWQPTDSDGILRAFKREKALKEAGFAAKDLPLMTSEIRHAEVGLKKFGNAPSEKQLQGDES